MAALALTLSSCGGGGGGDEAVADAGLPVVRSTENSTVYWIKDNHGERLMPVSLFPDAPQSLVDSLGVQDGVPASVGTFLMLCDDGTVLFDTGNGGENAGLYAGLDSLGMSPADVDYLYITFPIKKRVLSIATKRQKIFTQSMQTFLDYALQYYK